MTTLQSASKSTTGTSRQTSAIKARTRWVHMLMQLTKARLSLLVLWTTAVGFVLAVDDLMSIDVGRLTMTLLGTALAAIAASTMNQVIETSRDRVMERTKDRPLPRGEVNPALAMILAIACGLVGIGMLAAFVNPITASLALLTIVLYIAVYTPLKPRTTLNTFVGAVCGAIPPMIGWAAVTGRLDAGAWVLGAILFVWQIPHFLALAWMFRADYERGGFVMLPVIDPTGRMTSRVVLLTTLMLVPLALVVPAIGLAGRFYALGSVLLAVVFALHAMRLVADRSYSNARRVFLASLVYLTLLMALLVVDSGTAIDGTPPVHRLAGYASH